MPRKPEFTEFSNPEDASFDKLVQAIDRAYHRPWTMMWRSFMHGIMTAIGAAVGWILILILSGLLFQALGGVQLFQPLLEKMEEAIQRTQQRSTMEQQEQLLQQLEQQQLQYQQPNSSVSP